MANKLIAIPFCFSISITSWSLICDCTEKTIILVSTGSTTATVAYTASALGATATTLFFMGPQEREWGFLTKTRTGRDRWIKSEHYLTDWKPYHEKYVMAKANRKEK